MTPDDIIDDIIRREGGFVDHPADKGGPTKYGITQDTLAGWRGRAVTADDVRGLSKNEAREIYRNIYIVKPGFDRIRSKRLMALVVDCAVNHGPATAARWLQDAARVPVDGYVGPVTIKAVNGAPVGELYRYVLAERCRHYGRIITRDQTQAVFAAGWANRVAEFIEETP